MITFLWIAGCLLVLLGVVGTVLPALPGLPILFAGSLLIAWAGDFQQIAPGGLEIQHRRLLPHQAGAPNRS